MTNEEFQKLEIKEKDIVFIGNLQTKEAFFGVVQEVEAPSKFHPDYWLTLNPAKEFSIANYSRIKKIENIAQEVLAPLNGCLGPLFGLW